MASDRIYGYYPQVGVDGYTEEPTSKVRLRIIRGKGLMKKDIFGASDPYVRIDLNTISGDETIDAVLTKTKKKTLNPEWNEEFIFSVKPTEHKLILQVFDENRLTRDDFLGMVEISLMSLPKEQENRVIPPIKYLLKPRSARSRVKGYLEIYHALFPDSPELAPQSGESSMDSTEREWEIIHDGREESVAVLCALHFYSHGSYQKFIGQDLFLSISQTMVSRCIEEVSKAMTQHLSERYIQFPQTPRDKLKISQGFMEKLNIPGVIGCEDCTHIAITAPPNDDSVHPGFAYLNRKGFHSINCQIICDSNMKILHCNACYPGSMHDSAIWTMSNVFDHFQDAYINNNERGFWLLGDSGYPLQPWLLTPIEGAAAGTPEGRYTKAHITLRNVIERCNGVLKMRFRCLSKQRVLHYNPISTAYIKYACCILHNILRTYNIDDNIENIEADDEINNNNLEEIAANMNFLAQGRRTRDQLIRNYFT